MTKVVTPAGRTMYVNVFNAKENKMSGKLEYSLVLALPKGANLSVLEKAIVEAAENKWGKDKSTWPKIKSPLRSNEEKRTADAKLPPGFEEGGHFITLKSKDRPGLVDANLNDIIAEQDFYSGCWAMAQVSAYAYDQVGNRGVSFGLLHLQKVKDGEPLTGRQKAADVFAPIEGDAAPTATNSANSLFS